MGIGLGMGLLEGAIMSSMYYGPGPVNYGVGGSYIPAGGNCYMGRGQRIFAPNGQLIGYQPVPVCR